MPVRQLKRICFTLNNYSEDDETRIQSNVELYQYAIYGREEAPTTGTRHLQGFINFKRRESFNRIKDIIGQNAHIELARGSDQQNKTYCSKDGNNWEFGEARGQGHRSDLESVVIDIKNGNSLRDIVESHTGTFIRYYRGIERTLQIYDSEIHGRIRNFKTQVSYIRRIYQC